MNKKKTLYKYLTYISLIAIFILLDQLTKVWLYGKSCSVIGDFLWLESPALNTGAAFNMLNNNVLLIILASAFSLAMIYLIFCEKIVKSRFLKISLSILLGGTVGNIIDRIAFGGVRDFIYLKSINFAIFNFADVFVNIGVYLIIGYLIYYSLIKKDDNASDKKKNFIAQKDNRDHNDDSDNNAGIDHNDDIDNKEDSDSNNDNKSKDNSESKRGSKKNSKDNSINNDDKKLKDKIIKSDKSEVGK
ncbi:MAG: signal peptidase II [Clostridia bacterium]|nr:signal peptidase II [Clostridia bacterium]